MHDQYPFKASSSNSCRTPTEHPLRDPSHRCLPPAPLMRSLTTCLHSPLLLVARTLCLAVILLPTSAAHIDPQGMLVSEPPGLPVSGGFRPVQHTSREVMHHSSAAHWPGSQVDTSPYRPVEQLHRPIEQPHRPQGQPHRHVEQIWQAEVQPGVPVEAGRCGDERAGRRRAAREIVQVEGGGRDHSPGGHSGTVKRTAVEGVETGAGSDTWSQGLSQDSNHHPVGHGSVDGSSRGPSDGLSDGSSDVSSPSSTHGSSCNSKQGLSHGSSSDAGHGGGRGLQGISSPGSGRDFHLLRLKHRFHARNETTPPSHDAVIDADKRRRRRLERRELATTAEVALGGATAPLGYFYTELSLGTPPQPFQVIVDTGSALLYVPCATCKCGTKHADPPFNPKKSATYAILPCPSPLCTTTVCTAAAAAAAPSCPYSLQYSEGSSTAGVMATDTLTIAPSLGSPKIAFGCETQETGLIYSQTADGVLGMGRGATALPTQLASAGVIDPQFSICFGGKEGGGALVLGSISLFAGTVWVPTVSNTMGEPMHFVNLENVLLGGESVLSGASPANAVTAMLDSGTTYTYLPAVMFQALVTKLSRKVQQPTVRPPANSPASLCWSVPASGLPLSSVFPNASFVFGPSTAIVTFPPDNYLAPHPSAPAAVCLGLFTSGSSTAATIGGISMHNLLLTHDLNRARVGFTPINCTDVAAGRIPLTAPPSTAPSEAPIQAGESTLSIAPSKAQSVGPSSPGQSSGMPRPGSVQTRSPQQSTGPLRTGIPQASTGPQGRTLQPAGMVASLTVTTSTAATSSPTGTTSSPSPSGSRSSGSTGLPVSSQAPVETAAGRADSPLMTTNGVTSEGESERRRPARLLLSAVILLTCHLVGW